MHYYGTLVSNFSLTDVWVSNSKNTRVDQINRYMYIIKSRFLLLEKEVTKKERERVEWCWIKIRYIHMDTWVKANNEREREISVYT